MRDHLSGDRLAQREDGIVDFNSDRCIGCKACMQACPYDSIYIDPNTSTAAKCNFCTHRLEIGLQPSCVAVCPEQAIIAGDMNDPTSEISAFWPPSRAGSQAGERNRAEALVHRGGRGVAGADTGRGRTDAACGAAGHLTPTDNRRTRIRCRPAEFRFSRSVTYAG